MNNDFSLPLLPDDATRVPVLNCIVALKTGMEGGVIAAEVANLDGISAEGATERDVLTAISRRFRETVGGFLKEGR
ncbi:MAG: hypothetical protein KDA96_26815, partial [Planctomycetaceae bacterium]|nr:hypothetical protein [Planctomycetaceae bacterium]